MEKRVKRHFTPATKLTVVQRYAAGESPGALGREFAIRPTLVHQWVTAYRRKGMAGLRPAGRPALATEAAALLAAEPAAVAPLAGQTAEQAELVAARQRIAALEHKIGQQQLEMDFFRKALRQVESVCPPAVRPGAPASTPSSGRRRNRKAD